MTFWQFITKCGAQQGTDTGNEQVQRRDGVNEVTRRRRRRRAPGGGGGGFGGRRLRCE